MLMYQIKVSILHDICKIMLDVYSSNTRIDNLLAISYFTAN